MAPLLRYDADVIALVSKSRRIALTTCLCATVILSAFGARDSLAQSPEEIAGRYWNAGQDFSETLVVRSDGSFALEENRGGSAQRIEGRWEVKRSIVTFRPFLRDGKQTEQASLLIFCDGGCAFSRKFWRPRSAAPAEPQRTRSFAFLATAALVYAGVLLFARTARRRGAGFAANVAIGVAACSVPLTFCIGIRAAETLEPVGWTLRRELGISASEVRNLSGGNFPFGAIDVRQTRLRFDAAPEVIERIATDPRWGKHENGCSFEGDELDDFRVIECGWPTRYFSTSDGCGDGGSLSALCVNDSSGHVAFESWVY